MAMEQWEEEAVERFRSYLSETRKNTYGITAREVIVNDLTKENFDYQLQNEAGLKIAAELFRLVEDGKALARSRVWHTMAGYIKEEIVKRGLKGYLVYTPQFFVKKSEMKTVAAQCASIIEQGIKKNPLEKKFTHADYEFHKVDSFDTISLSFSDGGARSVDSRGTATKSFTEKLPKKNNQVSIADHERVIVVVNWSFFVGHRDAIRALSSFDFDELQNVDKIYFEVREGEFHLIFDRRVLEALKSKEDVADSEIVSLLEEYLKHQLADKKQSAFDFIKTTSESSGNLDWIKDNEAKENIVQFGTELLVQSRIDDAMWIVRMFHNDPNPEPTGANDSDDPNGEHNYHNRVLMGDDASVITTVRGHLCWLMMKIVTHNKPQYYTEIIAIMSRYLSEDNLYIRIQAIHILGVFWANRRATKNSDETPFLWSDSERAYIRQLVIDTVRANKAYPQIMRALLHIFNTIRDLSEEEAEEMLKLFIDTKHDDVLHDLAAYVMYFAFLREKDSQYYGGQFRSDKFTTLLKEQIINGANSISSSLAWHFWKCLTDKVLTYEEIKDYLPLFLEGDYSGKAMSKLSLIFEELIEIAPDDALNLYERSLDLLENFLKKNPENAHQHWVDATEEMIPVLATDPKRLVGVINTLKNIWLTGFQIYIGSIKTIFESYTLVSSEHKEATKNSLRAIYKEMKEKHPPLQEVNWDL